MPPNQVTSESCACFGWFWASRGTLPQRSGIVQQTDVQSSECVITCKGYCDMEFVVERLIKPCWFPHITNNFENIPSEPDNPREDLRRPHVQTDNLLVLLCTSELVVGRVAVDGGCRQHQDPWRSGLSKMEKSCGSKHPGRVEDRVDTS
jgi:hypothetical protein